MSVFEHFWRYWKWLCVALMTTFVVLAALAMVINYFKTAHTPDKQQITHCIDNGGAWDADANEGAGACKTAA